MTCPYIVGDTTKHCALAETRVRELEQAIRDITVAFDVDSLDFDDFETVVARAWRLLPEVTE